jgi:hypothetical protein
MLDQNRPLTREQGAAQLADDLQLEGWNARMRSVPIAECPYANTGLKDSHWGVNCAAEWLRGWHDADAMI